MPMDIVEFEESEERENRSTGELIVEFLLENRDMAFRRKEIADAIDRTPNTVGTNLSRLKERRLVRHRKNHWALTTDLERVRDAIEFSRGLERLNVEEEPLIEDEEEAQRWAETQPAQPHPSSVTGDEFDEESADEQ
jgi:Mn-dependent DtxR family transcriptional regulator